MSDYTKKWGPGSAGKFAKGFLNRKVEEVEPKETNNLSEEERKEEERKKARREAMERLRKARDD